MCQLFQACRLCFNMTGIRFRSAFPWFESYQAASASLYDQVWMTGWRFTSSMPTHNALFEFVFCGDPDVAQDRPREFGQEALDEIESRTMLGGEGKLEASRRSRVEPGSCFSRYVRGKIIEDQLDRGAGSSFCQPQNKESAINP